MVSTQDGANAPAVLGETTMTQSSIFDHDSTLERKFKEYHAKNPEVYTRLVALTDQGLRAGKRKVGIGMLFEVIRWEQFLRTEGDSFKLNNNYRSRYARKLMDENFRFVGMFEIRELKSENK